MSKQIQSELRRYMSYLDTQVAPVTIDEMTERHFGTESVRPIGLRQQSMDSRPRRRWLAAVASAAAVLVLVGGLALLAPGAGSDAPVAPTPQIDSLSSLTWSRMPHDEAVFGGEFGQSMFDVTVGGPGLVAVGESGKPGDFDAAVWTSPDGITWSRVPHNESVFGGPAYQGMFSVTVGGIGLVAVGSEGPHYDPFAAVWTSLDGITWSKVPHDETVFGGATMSNVAVGGPGLVAVGRDGDPQTNVGNDVMWTSPDGITWSQVPHNEEIFGGQPQASMGSVTIGGPGLVAVGESGSEPDFDAAVWIATVED